MQSLDTFLMSLGGILFLGLVTSTVGGRTFLPRVTMLLLLGIVLGDNGLKLLPSLFTQSFDTIAQITLMIVGFLIGGKLQLSELKRSASLVFSISLSAAVVTAITVTIGLVWIGVEVELAVLLGAIASATAPAAIVDVVQESGVDSDFTKTLLSVVALDDVWALLLFAFALAFVANLTGVPDASFIINSVVEIVGAVALGALIGLPGAYLTGRIRSGQPMMLEAMSLVCICGGLALWLDLSYLIATMTMGAVIVNLAKHHEQPFHQIENIENLFLVVFFIVAGASLELSAVTTLGWIGIMFVILRVIGKYLGAWFGAWFGAWIGASVGDRISTANESIRHGMRYALLPQAGVSIGMALVTAAQFPQYQQVILTLVIGSTVVFELVGPVFTRIAIQRSEQAKQSTNTK